MIVGCGLHRINPSRAVCLTIAVLGLFLGCQSRTWEANRIERAEILLLQAQDHWSAKQAEQACRTVEAALELNGLEADQLLEAQQLRFDCLLQLQRFDEAQAHLNRLGAMEGELSQLQEWQQRLNDIQHSNAVQRADSW